MIFSFNSSKSRILWTGFTFEWYKSLFEDKEILKSLNNTLFVAFTASIFATIIGTIAAAGILKLNKYYQKVILSVTRLPLINPEIVNGISLMLLFVFIHKKTGFFEQGIFTLILSHITFCLPYVVLSVIPKLRQLTPNIYEAALDLGCTPFSAFLKVVLREIMPGVVTGGIMAFTVSIDDFVVSYFTGGAVQTLSISIYSMSKRSISPKINALSTLLFLSTLILLIIINFRESKENIKKKELI
jgi:spermidine/putrescine transport system permease protein